MKKVLLPLLLFLPCVSSWGFDAYFYNSTDNRPAHIAQGAVSIAFNSTTTVVRRPNFADAEIDNSDFNHMLFRDKSTSGVSAVAGAGDAIRVSLSGDMLHVSAPGPIDGVFLSSVSGMEIFTRSSAGAALSVDMSALAQGVYIVRVLSCGQTVVTKVVKK